MWAASLNRAHLSVPSAVFQFIDQSVPHRKKWWPSARREVGLIQPHAMRRTLRHALFRNDLAVLDGDEALAPCGNRRRGTWGGGARVCSRSGA